VKSRRSFLGTAVGVGVLGIAGCSSGEEDAQNPENGGDGSQEQSFEIIDSTRQVDEDQYLAQSFTLNDTANIEVQMTVRKGPAIDVLTMSADEFDHFENRERFRYFPELSIEDGTGGSASGTLDPGEYVLVIDNTNAGEAQPPTNFDDDLARVEITAQATKV